MIRTRSVILAMTLACSAAFAATPAPPIAPATITIVTDPGVVVQTLRRADNTNKTISIMVNKQDVVKVTTVVPPLPPPDHTMSGPAIDLTRFPKPIAGYSDFRWRDVPAGCAGNKEVDPKTCAFNVYIAYPSDIGAFRVPSATPALYAKDDPLVLPGQPGASHMHAVYGPVDFNANSTQETLSKCKASSFAGGTAICSAAWVPALIDERGGPVEFALNYYQKGSYEFDISSIVVPIPAGLRMVSGDAKNTDPAKASGRFECADSKGDSGWQSTIPQALATGHCTVGATFYMSIGFPYCWDGKNLDSPDHRSHMSNVQQLKDTTTTPWSYPKSCPATHPVAIPVISYQMTHKITATDQPAKWFFSSDMDMTKPAGVSFHGDYWANVKPEIEASVSQHCIREKRDGHDFLTCDGKTLY